MSCGLSVEQTRQSLLAVAAGMIASEAQLSEADRQIGDGDHGVGMARGFTAVQQKLSAGMFATQAEVLNAAGMALMMSVGGASGAIFGTFFRGGAKALGDVTELCPRELAIFLNEGCAAVCQRGGATPGDKTMVDALFPAAQTCAELAAEGSTLLECLRAAAQAAERGMEETRNMLAVMGRAKTLGERSLGHPDPGAISMSLILHFWAQAVSQEAGA